MSPAMAIYYSFHSADPSDDSAEVIQLGPEAALAQLKELGCRLATQQWVTNHYGLILWKLSGLVCLEPEREMNPKTKRWCWSEVMRQLRYRSAAVPHLSLTVSDCHPHQWSQVRARAQRGVTSSAPSDLNRRRTSGLPYGAVCVEYRHLGSCCGR